MKENSIEELKQRLEELYKTQQARLACNADDLDIREEIAEVEEEIKELQDDTNVDRKNNIEEAIKVLEKFKNDEMQRDKLERDIRCGGWKIGDIYKCLELDNAIEHILSDYKRLREYYEEQNEVNAKFIPKQKIKDIIDRIDYDIEKTKEIISKNTSVYATYRKNDYQIVRLRAMNTKSLDIKRRLQKLLESEE